MKELTVENLIKGVEKRQFLLPTIQRGFVWETKKIETLFDSLMRGFPISSFLFWEVPDEDEHTFKFYNFVKNYDFYSEDPRSFADFGKAPHMAVLDGQQRITSFYIGLKGSYIPKGKADVPQKLYLNLLKMNADSDNGDADAELDNVYEFKFLTDEDAAKIDAETFWFEVGKILDRDFDDSVNIAEYLLQYKALVDAKTHSYLKLPYQILNRLWHCVKIKNVIEYHLESKKNLDEVLNIFVRINNGGKPVEISELLLSLATAQLKDFDVESELIGIVNEINNIGGEKSFNVSNDFMLRAFLVLCNDGFNDKKSIKFSVENFKPKRMQKIRAEWDKMSAAIKSAVKLVNEFGFSQRHFASNNILIPLAHYIYLKDNDAAAYFDDKGKMIHWFISMTLKGIFRTNTDEQLNRLRNVLNKSHESFPLKELLDAKDKSDKELAEELINALMHTNYKLMKNVLMALTILYDGKKDLATVDVDHMFPKIKIKNLGEFAGQGIVDFEKFQTDYEKFCNALPNLQLLDSSENKKKHSTFFSDWIAAKPSDERAKYMAENFVPDVDFKLANFKNFIEARRKLIRSKIEENLKKRGVIYSTSPVRDLFIEGQERKIADAVTDTDGKIILTILYEKYDPLAYVYNKNYEKILINIKFAYKLIEDGRAVKIFPKTFDGLAKDFEKLQKAMDFPDGKFRILTGVDSDNAQYFSVVQENFALARINFLMNVPLLKKSDFVLINDEEFLKLKKSVEKVVPIDGQELKIVDAVTDTDGKIILMILYEGDGPMAYFYDKNYKKVRLNAKFAYKLIDDGRAVKIPPDEFNGLAKNYSAEKLSPVDKVKKFIETQKFYDFSSKIDKDAQKLQSAMIFPDGKIKIRYATASDNTNFYSVVQKDYKLDRLYIETTALLVKKGAAVLISDEEFQQLKKNPPPTEDKQSARELKKIIDMATRIKKQFANAAVTKDGKFMFYADHNGVEIGPGAPNWNPSFYVVNEDLLTPRVSLDIMLQEIVPKNLFVEITKADVDAARRIAKTRGKAAAFNYLEKILNS